MSLAIFFLWLLDEQFDLPMDVIRWVIFPLISDFKIQMIDYSPNTILEQNDLKSVYQKFVKALVDVHWKGNFKEEDKMSTRETSLLKIPMYILSPYMTLKQFIQCFGPKFSNKNATMIVMYYLGIDDYSIIPSDIGVDIITPNTIDIVEWLVENNTLDLEHHLQRCPQINEIRSLFLAECVVQGKIELIEKLQNAGLSLKFKHPTGGVLSGWYNTYVLHLTEVLYIIGIDLTKYLRIDISSGYYQDNNINYRIIGGELCKRINNLFIYDNKPYVPVYDYYEHWIKFLERDNDRYITRYGINNYCKHNGYLLIAIPPDVTIHCENGKFWKKICITPIHHFVPE